MRRAAALKALWTAVTRQRRPGGASLRTLAAAVPRMVVQSMSGRYPGLERSRLALMALAVLYVVSPVDLVPEAALFLLGVADDAMVLAWLAGAMISEADAFLDWEAGAGGQGGGPQAESSRRRSTAEQVVPGEVL